MSMLTGRNHRSRFSAAAAMLFLGVVASVAQADGWPTSAAGTYDVVGNQSTGKLVIIQNDGATGSQCKPITGTIYDDDSIEGFYCPGSGRIAFVRKQGLSAMAAARQFWSGNLSQSGATRRIGGTFYSTPHNGVSGTDGGSLGEYSFSAED